MSRSLLAHIAQIQMRMTDVQNSSHTTTSQSSIDSTTKKQLSDIETAVKDNRDAVIKKIVERVLQCDPHLHPNLKKIEA